MIVMMHLSNTITLSISIMCFPYKSGKKGRTCPGVTYSWQMNTKLDAMFAEFLSVLSIACVGFAFIYRTKTSMQAWGRIGGLPFASSALFGVRNGGCFAITLTAKGKALVAISVKFP
jgi:hypothetical protein